MAIALPYPVFMFNAHISEHHMQGSVAGNKFSVVGRINKK
jgi:hypothetical protein